MLIATCIALFVAGTVADWLVVRATRHDPEAGLIVGLVAAGLGALVTLGIAVVAGVLLSGLALTLYLVAVTPLVVGSLVRIVRAYRETHETQRMVIAREQNHALHEMRRIRQRMAGGQVPAEDTGETG